MVIKTNDLAVVLKKVSSEDVKGLSMEQNLNYQTAKFELPDSLPIMGDGDVDAKVTNETILTSLTE